MLPNASTIDYTVECYIRPGLSWSLEKQRDFVAELRGVVMESFCLTHESQLPAYQCCVWPDEASQGAGLNDKVIAVARERVQWPSKRRGKMLAFNSAVLFSIPGLSSPILHLGLTCIIPSARSYGLTRVFTTRIVIQAFLRFSAFRSENLWITSLACVVSSLGSVARGFDAVWPSPEYPHVPPSNMYAHIANSIAESPSIREAMYIPSDCIYDPDMSVFRGSVKGTVFAKERDDKRYRFRDKETHSFYESRINWERGDEVLQVFNMSHAFVLRLLLQRPTRFKLLSKL
jgi:hypothetical protein